MEMDLHLEVLLFLEIISPTLYARIFSPFRKISLISFTLKYLFQALIFLFHKLYQLYAYLMVSNYGTMTMLVALLLMGQQIIISSFLMDLILQQPETGPLFSFLLMI